MAELTAQQAFELAVQHHVAGRLSEAESLYQRILASCPDFAEAYGNMGDILVRTGRIDEAIEACHRAAALRPDFPDVQKNLAGALRLGGKFDEAIAVYRQALALRPDDGEFHYHLAHVLRDVGELDESIACFRRAAALTGSSNVAGNLLFTLHFHPDYGPRRLLEEHLRWNQTYARPVETSIVPHENPGAVARDRPLRVGYVSCDLHYHPIARFLLPLWQDHDRRQFRIVCYNYGARADLMTEHLRGCADEWRDVADFNDEQLARLVRQDRIDILIDLSLHAQVGRMMTFARKPAPVQVSYLAYCSTSGLTTMDYRLSDPHLDPPGGDEGVYMERTVRLPRTYWCYLAPEVAPPVSALPARTAGHVTFGCLNVFAKVTNLTLSMWCALLRRAPTSKLLLHAPGHRHRVLDRAAAEGIDPRRFEFVGFLPVQEYFRQYQQIDIALDPFPYAGGTTTLDALWMGVPVVSLTGSTAVSRGGLSILSNLSLSEFVTDSPERYVQIAADLAGNGPQLEELRSTLRERMRSSPLMDANAFARDIEAAYRWMWHAWCDGKRAST